MLLVSKSNQCLVNGNSRTVQGGEEEVQKD